MLMLQTVKKLTQYDGRMLRYSPERKPNIY